jgi:uncharacterized protein
MLKRKVTREIEQWGNSESNKALFIVGARQIGKSFAIREFGKSNFKQFIEINLYENDRARKALADARSADDFITRVTVLTGQSIISGETLVFIDEVQESRDIMTMVKFLVEDGRCRWAFSGSMLGTELKGIKSYPVGYVHEITMRPMDFEEFCWAIGVSSAAFGAIEHCCDSETPIDDYIHDAMMSNFRTYLVVGGMPEVVQRFLDSKGDMGVVRNLQIDLNVQYKRDISKYAGRRALNVQGIYDLLPIQLEGDNHRFMVGSIDESARYRGYEHDFVWLERAGVVLKANQVSEPKSPLLKTADVAKFKLYQSDVGMLMARYPLATAQAAYLDDKSPNLGGVYENAIAQQLVAQGYQLYFFNTRKRGEVDFVAEGDDGVAVPIEVKSGLYYHAHASLDKLLANEGYGLEQGIVLSRGNIERDGKVLYLPLYAVYLLPKYLDGSVKPCFKLRVRQV